MITDAEIEEFMNGYANPDSVEKEPEKLNVLALASMISGFLGFFTGITFIIAIILGHMSLNRQYKDNYKGSGMAFVGLTLGYLGVIGLVIVLFGLAIMMGTAGLYMLNQTGPK